LPVALLQNRGENKVKEYLMGEIWEVIHVYTRAQALADGVLIDISDTAKKCGFMIPTAITETLRVSYPEDKDLVPLLIDFNFKIRAMKEPNLRLVELVDRFDERVWLSLGPDDDGDSPCITIMRPKDY